MRRPVLALTCATALTVTIALAPSASAVGPGGWSHVGVGSSATTASLNGTVTALNTQNPGVLYAGGNFTMAGGNTKAQRIARWNGSNWSSLGNTPLTNGQVFAIAYHAGKVYVGGTFHNAGGNANADFLAVWDGSTWSSPCISTGPDPAIMGNVNALQIVGNTLYVGGAFANGADIASADYLVGCDLTTKVASSTVTSDGSMSGAVDALTADSNGTLYAGGGFINLEGIADADHVAAYDGSWHAMGDGVEDYVRSLAAAGTNVYVGTDAINVAGIAKADHVARWDGSTWHAVGANTAGTDGWFSTATAYTIDGLATYGSNVIAAGSFQNANGVATADNIAYFDGTRWRPIGSNGAGNGPLPGHAVAVGITNGQLYAGGNFTTAGGDTRASYIAAYSLRLPDAAIGATSSGHFTGNNTFSSTGAGEVKAVTVKRGHSGHAYIKVQNDGLVPASFTLKGTGSGSGFVVHYYRGTANITSHVLAGTYTTPTIDARSNVLIRLVVHVKKKGAPHATFTTAARSTSGTPPDAVRLIARAG